MDLSTRNILWRSIGLIVGGIFVYAGVIKALDPLRFATDIDNYKMLPWAIGVRLAFYLPWLEMLCGLALILRFFYRGGLFILSALTFIFIAASIIAKVRGLDITCGCFGHASKNWSFSSHVLLDLVVLAGLIALWISNRAQQQEL
jgi:putative oxidoreductase